MDRAHEAADRQEPQCRHHAPSEAKQILLRQPRRHARLAQRQQDLLAPQRKRHDRQRDQRRGPQAGAQRAPDQMRIAPAESLRGQRGNRRHQSHPKGEADEIDRASQRRRRDGVIAEAPDKGEVGRHHRNLPKLCQRDRRRQLEGLG